MYCLNSIDYSLHKDEEPLINENMNIGDIVISNDLYIVICLSRIDKDGHMKVGCYEKF